MIRLSIVMLAKGVDEVKPHFVKAVGAHKELYLGSLLSSAGVETTAP
jgi:hypothetical protein